MKKKGFTLIELIVVIAIIGVLAAILVPAMLGYVKRSKITTANTTAKNLYNAFESAITEVDSEDEYKISDLAKSNTPAYTITGTKEGNDGVNDYWDDALETGAASSVDEAVEKKVMSYFDDLQKVTEFTLTLDDTRPGRILGIGVLNGAYPGSYPNQMTTDWYDAHDAVWTSADAADVAENGSDSTVLDLEG